MTTSCGPARRRSAPPTSRASCWPSAASRRPISRIVEASATADACYEHVVRTLPDTIAAGRQRGDGPYRVFADAGQFSRALAEVLDNAIEAMPRGGRLTLRVAGEHLREALPLAPLAVPAGRYVVVSVTDTGAGMSAEAVAVACDPFYSTKPAHLGAGLGLASVHGFIASHSGGLAIESAPGQGTTVRLYLPAV